MPLGEQYTTTPMHDASGKIQTTVWRFKHPEQKSHHDFQVNVGDGWVCIGGGADASVGSNSSGNFLTGSFPSGDWKGWHVLSRDHVNDDKITLVGYAIGMKIEGLSRDELISKLKIFQGETTVHAPHPDLSVSIKEEEGFVLLGGGFEVLVQPPGGGNMATASFPDSTISWRARSKDENILSPSLIRVFAIGIQKQIIPTGPSKGNIITTFASAEELPGHHAIQNTATTLPGYALCGGGAVDHYLNNQLLYILAPTEKPNPGLDQTFTGVSWSHLSIDPGTMTAYAMGIKFEPIIDLAPPGCPDGQHLDCVPDTPTPPVCNTAIPVSTAMSSGNQSTFLPANAIDSDPDTKWMSTNSPNPFIRLDLGTLKSVCRVDITWADTNTRYFFNIATSQDGNNFSYVFAGARIGTAISSETYSFPVVQARYVRVTINQSTPYTPNSQAQISEIKLFGP